MINYYIITLFSELFDWFANASIIGRAIKKSQITINFVNPRNWTQDKNHTIDDEIYGWWQWLLIKAKPIIEAITDTITKIWTLDYQIIYLAPSHIYRNQNLAQKYQKVQNIILVCWRYEGIDHRFELFMMDNYSDKYQKISIGKYILMWWEVASMVVIESTARLGDIILAGAPEIESYDPAFREDNIEFPQYTRPAEVFGYEVPQVLLSWNHAMINQRRNDNIL